MKKFFHSALIISLLTILLIIFFNSNSFAVIISPAYKKAVLNRAIYYKNKGYKAANFGFTYDWCLGFVNRCFTSSGHDPKGFRTDYTSCSRQVEYICKNNPSSFTFIMTAASIKSKHSTTYYYKVSDARFSTSFVPTAGDVFFLDNKDSDRYSFIACHTGFVTGTSVINGKRYIYTIEGNVDGYSTKYTRYYQNSIINTKKYQVTNTGVYLVKSNGTLNYSRQILGYYSPVFNY